MKTARQYPPDVCYKCGAKEGLIACTGCRRLICLRERIGTGSVCDGYQCSLFCSIAENAPDIASRETEKTGIHLIQGVKSAGKFLLGVLLGCLSAALLYEFFHR